MIKNEIEFDLFIKQFAISTFRDDIIEDYIRRFQPSKNTIISEDDCPLEVRMQTLEQEIVYAQSQCNNITALPIEFVVFHVDQNHSNYQETFLALWSCSVAQALDVIIHSAKLTPKRCGFHIRYVDLPLLAWKKYQELAPLCKRYRHYHKKWHQEELVNSIKELTTDVESYVSQETILKINEIAKKVGPSPSLNNYKLPKKQDTICIFTHNINNHRS